MRSIKLIAMVLVVILVIGLLSSIDLETDKLNNNSSENNDGDNNVSNFGSHRTFFTCEGCDITESLGKDTNFDYYVEYYGSIGACYYNVCCESCDQDCEGFEVRHVYDDSGRCLYSGCAVLCDHTFTEDAISFVVPYSEEFSMFDEDELYEDPSSVYNGVCTICGMNFN